MDFLNIDTAFLFERAIDEADRARQKAEFKKVYDRWLEDNREKIEFVKLYDVDTNEAHRKNLQLAAALDAVRSKLVSRMKQILRGLAKPDYQNYVYKRKELWMTIPPEQRADPPDIFNGRLSTNQFLEAVQEWNRRMHYHKKDAEDPRKFLADLYDPNSEWFISGIPSWLRLKKGDEDADADVVMK